MTYDTAWLLRRAEMLLRKTAGRRVCDRALMVLGSAIEHAYTGKPFTASRHHSHDFTEAEYRYAWEKVRECGIVRALPRPAGQAVVSYIFQEQFLGETLGEKSSAHCEISPDFISPSNRRRDNLRDNIPPLGGDIIPRLSSSPRLISPTHAEPKSKAKSKKAHVEIDWSRVDVDRAVAKRLTDRSCGDATLQTPHVPKDSTRAERIEFVRLTLQRVFPRPGQIDTGTLAAHAEIALANLASYIPEIRLSDESIRKFHERAAPTYENDKCDAYYALSERMRDQAARMLQNKSGPSHQGYGLQLGTRAAQSGPLPDIDIFSAANVSNEEPHSKSDLLDGMFAPNDAELRARRMGTKPHKAFSLTRKGRRRLRAVRAMRYRKAHPFSNRRS